MAEETYTLNVDADTTDAESKVATLKQSVEGETATITVTPELAEGADVGIVDDLTTLETEGVSIPVETPGAAEAAEAVGSLKDSLENIPVVGPQLAEIAGQFEDMRSKGAGIGEAIAGVFEGIGGFALVGTAISTGISLWSSWRDRAKEAAEEAQKVADAQRDINDAISEGNLEDAASQLIEMYDGAYEAAQNAGLGVSDLTDFITGQTSKLPLAAAGYKELTDEQKRALSQYNQMGGAVSGTTAELAAQARTQLAVNDGLHEAQLAASDARVSYRDSQGTITDYDATIKGVAESLGGTSTATDDATTTQEELDAAAQAAAETLAAEEAGARSLAEAMGSVEWQQADVQGATSAMTAYTDELFRSANIAQATGTAQENLRASIEENGLVFSEASEAGFAQNDAMEALARTIDTQLIGAYDDANGSVDTFRGAAKGITNETLGPLIDQFDLTEQQVKELTTALGLTPEQITSRFELAGTEEAKLQLGLLDTAIAGLPPETQTQVNMMITAGDYVGARDLIQDSLDESPVYLETKAEMEGFEPTVLDTIDGITPPPIHVPADADDGAAHVDEQLTNVVEKPRTAEIGSEGDPDPANEALEGSRSMYRLATIVADADASIADNTLNRTAGAYRQADITAVAHTGDAESALNNAARTRYANVYVVTHGTANVSAAAGGGRSARGRGRGAAPVAASTTVAPINVTLNSAVIGDRYDVQRVVTRAVRSAARLRGARLARAEAGSV